MDQQLTGAARCILGDEDGTGFHVGWQTLLGRLQRKFHWLDRECIADALADALLRRFSQENGGVEGALDESGDLAIRSLYGEVCHLVSNRLRADKRRRCREREYARQKKKWVFEDFFVQNELSAEHISIEDHWEELERLLSECDSWEQEFVALRKQGVTDPSAYAEVLGMARCPLAERHKAIAQAWNRIRMKLRRKQRQAHDADRP